MYHGPADDTPGRGEAAKRRLRLRSHREVVVDHGHLPVEQEVRVGRVGIEAGEQVVEQVDEPQPERLERRVPLAVPVRVRNDRHRSFLVSSCGDVVVWHRL